MSERVDHWIPLFGRDFLASTIGWPDAAVGAYIRLLIVQWDQGGLPESMDELRAIAATVSDHWARLGPKFPVCEDGKRRNPRMEEHREKSVALKSARSEAGRRGGLRSQSNRRGSVKQGFDFASSKTQANGQANGQAKTKPPSPSPSPPEETTLPSGVCVSSPRTHTREAGWAAKEWDAFVAVWNATKRATPWTHLTAPQGWADVAATPGWIDRARAAMAHLPRCEFFTTPLAVTRFMGEGFVDRILAGEFDNPKPAAGSHRVNGQPDPSPRDPAKRRWWRPEAGESMTDSEFAAWAAQRRGGAR
jgi:hypothetical protein